MLGGIGLVVMLGIVWLINGPMTDAKLRRIVKEETGSLTRMPASAEDTIRIYDAHGTPYLLKDFAGKPLILNVWATWCPPCIKELPALAALEERYAGAVRVVAASVDANGFTEIDAFIAQHPMKHPPFYHDRENRLFPHLKIRGLPTTYILNAQGQTIAKLERIITPDDKEITALLDELIRPAQPEAPSPVAPNPVVQ